jgi:hypothetical protein
MKKHNKITGTEEQKIHTLYTEFQSLCNITAVSPSLWLTAGKEVPTCQVSSLALHIPVN